MQQDLNYLYEKLLLEKMLDKKKNDELLKEYEKTIDILCSRIEKAIKYCDFYQIDNVSAILKGVDY